jgi:hypothetical protein
VRPTLWTDPSPARSAIEPLLPQCLAGGDDSGEGAEAAAALGFREVALDLSEVGACLPKRKIAWFQFPSQLLLNGLAVRHNMCFLCSTQQAPCLNKLLFVCLPACLPAAPVLASFCRTLLTDWRWRGGRWRRDRARASLCGAGLAACHSLRVRCAALR